MNARPPADKPRSSREVQRMFSRIARRYDAANHLLSLGRDLRWRKRVAASLCPPAGAIVLDVCTGTGDSARFYREHRIRVYGLDFSHAMLKEARRKSRRSPTPYPVAWIEGDAVRLPLRQNTVDMLTIAFGLRNLTDMDAGLQEFHRVLKPGGTFVVLEFTLPRSPVWKAIYRVYLTRILPVLGGWITGLREPYRYLAGTIQAFPHYEDLVHRVRLAGFEIESMEPFFGGVATAYRFRAVETETVKPMMGKDK